MHSSSPGAVLRLSSALALILTAGTVSAQDAGGTYLGEITLGKSKRAVATDTATPVTTIDNTEAKDRQASTIAELIDSVPGVTLVNGSTPQGSGVNIRGFGANGTYGTDQKVAIQIDGASVGAEELYRIGTQLFTDPSLYKSVEVIRGTVGSFEYGSGIIGGVVRLETRDASDFTGDIPGFKARQTLGFGSNNDQFFSSTTLAWKANETFEVLGNFTWRQQQDQTDGYGKTIGNSAFKLPSALLKAKLSFGDAQEHSLTFSYNRSKSDEKDVPYDTFGLSGGGFGNVDRVTDATTVGLLYNYNPADNDLIDLDVHLTYADQQINQSCIASSGSCSRFLIGLSNVDQRYETTKLLFKNTARFDTGAVSHTLRAGLELSRRDRALAGRSAPGGRDQRLALFVIDEMKIGDAWTVTPALRYESQQLKGTFLDRAGNKNDYSGTSDALMGGISARYAFGNGFAVFGSAAYTESMPIIDDVGVPGKRNLSEKSRTYELGASYDGTDVFASGDTFSVKANLYQTQLWDVTSYFGITEVDRKGLELELAYAMEGGFYTDLNFNITEGEAVNTRGDRNRWANNPANSARLTVGKKWGEELDLSWEALFVDDSRTQTRSGTKRVPGYVTHALRATYVPQQGVLKDTEIRFGIENLLDQDYTARLSTRPAPGRTFKVTFAKTF